MERRRSAIKSQIISNFDAKLLTNHQNQLTGGVHQLVKALENIEFTTETETTKLQDDAILIIKSIGEHIGNFNHKALEKKIQNSEQILLNDFANKDIIGVVTNDVLEPLPKVLNKAEVKAKMQDAFNTFINNIIKTDAKARGHLTANNNNIKNYFGKELPQNYANNKLTNAEDALVKSLRDINLVIASESKKLKDFEDKNTVSQNEDNSVLRPPEKRMPSQIFDVVKKIDTEKVLQSLLQSKKIKFVDLFADPKIAKNAIND
jgi:hypothetical protein